VQHDVRRYWETHIHDLEITQHPAGSAGFFADLEQYHFEKLHHLPKLVPFEQSRGKRVLDVGCGAGTDLVRFARAGANVTGVDLAASSIALARQNFTLEGLHANLVVADGEKLPFAERSFDLVYAHGVMQYTTDAVALVRDCRRVLKPGGTAIFQVYNRVSWLNALSRVTKVELEHVDAPEYHKYSIGEFRTLLKEFSRVTIVPERFPVKTRLHGGLKGAIFNTCFVGVFNAMPRSLVRRFGWHLLAFCEI
jgi:ubiquinone/menaquinone biosynthesis C-methylase UbiE